MRPPERKACSGAPDPNSKRPKTSTLAQSSATRPRATTTKRGKLKNLSMLPSMPLDVIREVMGATSTVSVAHSDDLSLYFADFRTPFPQGSHLPLARKRIIQGHPSKADGNRLEKGSRRGEPPRATQGCFPNALGNTLVRREGEMSGELTLVRSG